MDKLEKAIVIIGMAKALLERGSWCGETHLQKSVHFLQELTEVPLDYGFILYKHGPFSFDLRDELTTMRSDGLLELKTRPAPYGPTVAPTLSGDGIVEKFQSVYEQYKRRIEFVANELEGKGAAELERLGTALLVTLHRHDLDQQQRAELITQLKPHVLQTQALEAVASVDRIYGDARSQLDLSS